MKKLSLQAKITLWFSVLIILITALAFGLMFVINNSVLHTNIRQTLLDTVAANAEEIEFLFSMADAEEDEDDQYLAYDGGYIEIDDDFLDEVGGVYTSLYDAQGNLLYGNGVVHCPLDLSGQIREVERDGETYYVYFQALQIEHLDGLVLKGVVNENANQTILSQSVRLSLMLLPLFAVVAILGGYLMARRSLRPIQKIAEAAEQISDGRDLSRRIPLPENENQDELTKLAKTFNLMFARLEKSFEAEKQFTSDVSHELRTPLSVIAAQCEFALKKDREASSYKNSLQVISRQSARMSALVEQMLSFSRLERMNTPPDLYPADVSRLCAQVCADFAGTLQNGIRLETKITPGLVVPLSISLFEQMLVNLLSNAYRYNRPDGTITVCLQQKDAQAVLSVVDTGTGMTPEQIEHIWQKFYRADASRTSQDQKNGLGIGLAVVKRIADLHGFSLKVESRENEGSTFYVFMHLAKEEPEKS